MSPPQALLSGLPNIVKAREFTDNKLQEMRAFVQKQQGLNEILLGTYGSYARREASAESDLDFFVICKSARQIEQAKTVLKPITNELIRIAGREPSPTGAFGDVEDLETMLSNIGGNDDH